MCLRQRTTQFVLVSFVHATLLVNSAPAAFSDFTEAAGISHRHFAEDFPVTTEVQIQTGGAAAGDYNNDGWVDLFVTRLDNSDILYRNNGANRLPGQPWFENVSEAAGLDIVDKTNAAAWGDIDNDGDLDLYVSVIEGPRYYLYINQGDGTFTEEAVERGADLTSSRDHHGYSVSFGDYDRDGWLDIHTCEWDIPLGHPDLAQHSALLRNRGASAPGHFENVTATAGVELDGPAPQFAFTSSFSDLDGDGWPDLLIAGDFGTSQLFWNNGNGTFTDGTDESGVSLGTNEMGMAVGDYDGDGDLDWWVTSRQDDNRMYRNEGNRKFTDQASSLGIENADWAWGTALFDAENDGDLDLLVTNGWWQVEDPSTRHLFLTPLYFWEYNNGTFLSQNAIQSGFADHREGKGLLTFDFDRDGDLDVFICNNSSKPILYRNNNDTGNSWLRLRFQGGKSNRQGIGVRALVKPSQAEALRVYELSGSSTFNSQSEPVMHIGLTARPFPIKEIQVQWPSGAVQTLTNVALNQRLTLEEPSLYWYQDWVAEVFSPEDQGRPDLVGRMVDVEGDKLVNLWEYALGLDPEVPNPGPHFSLRPAPDEPDTFHLTHTRGKQGDDLVFIYEYSVDGQTWEELTDFSTSVTPGAERDQIVIEFRQPGWVMACVRLKTVP